MSKEILSERVKQLESRAYMLWILRRHHVKLDLDTAELNSKLKKTLEHLQVSAENLECYSR